jgi:3-deoxy-D-manno-octulosonic-acid transferase
MGLAVRWGYCTMGMGVSVSVSVVQAFFVALILHAYNLGCVLLGGIVRAMHFTKLYPHKHWDRWMVTQRFFIPKCTDLPTNLPSLNPTTMPTNLPSLNPTNMLTNLPSIWLAGASAGECKQCFRLATKLVAPLENSSVPRRTCMITSVTGSGYELLQKLVRQTPAMQGSIHIAMQPWDCTSQVHSFVQAHRVQKLVLYENNLWPGMLRVVHKNHIPIFIVSGYMPNAQYKKYNPIPFCNIWQSWGESVQMVHGQTQGDVQNFASLLGKGPQYVGKCPQYVVAGDYKALNEEGTDGSSTRPLQLRTIHLALISLHQKEWAHVQQAVQRRLEMGQTVVVVPRFPSSFPMHIVYESLPSELSHKVTVVQEFGQVYKICSNTVEVWMGGSFAPGAGVHNFREPMQSGCAVCVGPYYQNQYHKVLELAQKGAIVCGTPAQWQQGIEPALLAQIAHAGLQECLQEQKQVASFQNELVQMIGNQA